MSVEDRKRRKVLLTRSGEPIGRQVAEYLANFRPTISDRPVHDGLKLAAVVALASQGGWTLELIGDLFGHPKGHVVRILRFAVRTVRQGMQLNPLESLPIDLDELDQIDGLDDSDIQIERDEADMIRRFAALPYRSKIRALGSVLDVVPSNN